MMRRLVFVAALLLPAVALGAPTPVLIADQPIAVTGTFTSSGQGNTVGSTVALNGNSVCATVWLAGQPGAALDLASGTLTTTLTPAVSADATQSGNGCTGGTWTPTGFIDYVTGNTTPMLAVSSPNAGALLAVREGPAVCARVCTAASATTGTAQAFLLATQAKATLAPAADVTDRAGRLLGVVYGSQGQQLQQTATNFNLRAELAVGATLIDPRSVRALTSADVVTANAGSGTFAVSAASLPLPTGAATSALQTTLSGQLPTVLDGSGFLKTHEQGTATVTGTVTANAGSGTMAVSAAALPLPTGAAADTSVNGILLTQGSTTSGQKGSLHQGAVTTSAPSYTTAQTSPLSLDTAGNLRVTAADIDVTAGATIISAICTDGNINACTGASTVAVSLAGENSASFSWVNSTFSSTLQADCQLGNGIWQIASAFLTGSAGTPNAAGIAYSASSVTGSGSVLCPQGSQAARIRANAAVTNSTSVFGRAAAAAGAFSVYGDGANHLQMIGSVSNDATAIGVGNETLPAVARASGTATTAGRAEKLQISSGAGGLFVEGPVANGATAAGNPLGMAGVGRATSAAPTQVTAGQSSALTTDLEHRLWVAAEHPNGFTCTVDAASASTQCVGLSGASLSYYIKSVSFSASAAITFKVNSSTTAGNACATAPALVIPTSYMGANTGGTFTFPQPIKVTANSALCCLPSGASGSCIIAGYIAP